MVKLVIETIGLQTPRGRLLFFGTASVLVFCVPYRLLEGLSLWQRLDIPSPSIGLTRAYRHVLHMDVAAAWQRNPLIFLVITIGAPILARDCYLLLRKGTRQAG